MKLIITIINLLMAFAATASEIGFKTDSQLPVELQQKIQSALSQKCNKLNYVTEVATAVQTVRIDQGIIDYYYTTDFTASWNFDGTHPVQTWVTVKSANYDISNPAFERFQVLDVSDSSGACQ